LLDAKVDQQAKKHITGNPGKGVKVKSFHVDLSTDIKRIEFDSVVE
jgi:hypothetical protein